MSFPLWDYYNGLQQTYDILKRSFQWRNHRYTHLPRLVPSPIETTCLQRVTPTTGWNMSHGFEYQWVYETLPLYQLTNALLTTPYFIIEVTFPVCLSIRLLVNSYCGVAWALLSTLQTFTLTIVRMEVYTNHCFSFKDMTLSIWAQSSNCKIRNCCIPE